ncbi:hypothetical protein [Candidatus Poriferisocius sp.]|uniref:hypothetical protein n=1 Tax=Candidatus Poriferisocius sp. TaxID=3101276 RepID=UPI003B01BDA2
MSVLCRRGVGLFGRRKRAAARFVLAVAVLSAGVVVPVSAQAPPGEGPQSSPPPRIRGISGVFGALGTLGV